MMAMTLRSASLLAALVPLLLSTTARRPAPIDPNRLRAHVGFLADDLLEGRGPGTRGGLLAERYVAAALASAGVAPAGENGTYFQKVPLVGVTTRPASTLSFAGGGGTLVPKLLDDAVVWSEALEEKTSFEAPEVLFAGYGIEAPEWRWNDYPADVSGKLLLMLVGDPPATPAEPELFAGRALTYHGRWTRKLELAASKGARGVLLVHTEASAGYGWSVVRGSWSGERSQLPAAPGERALRLAGWVTEGAAQRLMALAGADLAALRAAAGRRGFTPVPLPLKATVELESGLRRFEASNVAGRIAGTDPSRAEEAVLFGAHVDHLGIGTPDARGDAIYNGAVDDASGVACLLEVARTLAAGGGLPRSVLFLGFTAEEQGLKGSGWYASHPLVPPGRSAALVNLDGAKPWGEVEDFTLMGADRSPELARIAAETARDLRFRQVPDAHPEKGYFYRSDHFSLARVGVPCINLESGHTLRGKPPEAGAALEASYRDTRYHRPADQVDASWDFGALAQYATVARELGRRIAASPGLPRWRSGDEFEAARLASRAEGR